MRPCRFEAARHAWKRMCGAVDAREVWRLWARVDPGLTGWPFLLAAAALFAGLAGTYAWPAVHLSYLWRLNWEPPPVADVALPWSERRFGEALCATAAVVAAALLVWVWPESRRAARVARVRYLVAALSTAPISRHSRLRASLARLLPRIRGAGLGRLDDEWLAGLQAAATRAGPVRDRAFVTAVASLIRRAAAARKTAEADGPPRCDDR